MFGLLHQTRLLLDKSLPHFARPVAATASTYMYYSALSYVEASSIILATSRESSIF